MLSNEEILERETLEKAIQKAIDGGWKKPQPTDAYGLVYSYIDVPERLLFNHDFAKALWGEKKILREEITDEGARRTWYSQQKDWKEHLQQMVISEDPIKYLKENI